MQPDHLQSARKQFEYYKLLGEKTFEQLTDEQLHWQYNAGSNPIATIVKHLWGNMMSRWTDFLTTDGEKEWRQREAEFENDLQDRAEMLALWNEGWDCLFHALDSVNEQNKLLVNKVRDYQQSSPAMSSPDVDWTEFESDFQARAFLESRAARLSSLAYQMQSTKILHDNDNYQDALNDYAYAQYKKGANEPGFTEKVAEIKQFFPRSTPVTPPTP